MLSSEVLPAPFGPMIEAISPRRTEIDTSSTARTPPNRFETAVAARSSSSAGFSNRAPPKEFGRHMRQRYGWHDADAIKRMQPVTWLTGLSLGRGSALLPLIGGARHPGLAVAPPLPTICR